ncbi:MAG TPA: hypothetical protein GXZ61_01930 [Clostridiales bacterium]|nr:hypothetical protein [Clostridiales bacterium]
MVQPVADAHCDFLYYAALGEYSIDTLSPNQVITLERLKQGNVALQYFAAWVDTKAKKSPFSQCVSMIKTYHAMLKKHSDIFVEATPDFKYLEGKIATVLTVEDGAAIMGNIENIDMFHIMGVRAMTLTWNYPNELAYPATYRRNKGLTKLGKQAVKKMEELNTAIDFAHLSDKGIDDCLELTSKELVFSSHTNARAVHFSKRSLCDEHIKEIANRKGVIGVNFFHEQLCDKGFATIDDIVKHIEHIANVGGIDCVCIGSDFDGMNKYPKDLRHSGDFPKLINALSAAGFSQYDIHKIMYQNLFDFTARIVSFS